MDFYVYTIELEIFKAMRDALKHFDINLIMTAEPPADQLRSSRFHVRGREKTERDIRLAGALDSLYTEFIGVQGELDK